MTLAAGDAENMVITGKLTDSTSFGGDDKFHIKIWEEETNENRIVIYDNNLGGADDAHPITTLTRGTIKIHKL